MSSRISIARKINLLHLSVAILAIGGLIVNILAQQSYVKITQDTQIVTKASRYQALADMHHDGSKGALYRLLYAVSSSNGDKTKDGRAEAYEDIVKQTKSLKTRIAQLEALTLPDDIKTSVIASDKVLSDYSTYTLSIANMVLAGDIKKAQLELPKFEETYHKAEVVQDQVGDKIEGAAAVLSTQAQNLENLEQKISLGICLAFIFIFAALYMIMRKSVTQPLHNIAKIIQRMSAGDMSVNVADHGRKDEIGTILQALNEFKIQSIRSKELETSAGTNAKVEQLRREQMDAAVIEFKNSVAQVHVNLSSGIKGLANASHTLSEVAEDAGQNTKIGAEASEKNTHIVQQIAHATTEMQSSIREVGHQIDIASKAVAKTGSLATTSSVNVTQLASAAQQIDSVIDLIRAIAAQTNLLALNATIEAARAGETGKGFAVVATEVKTLAGQTAQATNDIAAQITSVKACVDATVNAIGDMVGTFSQVEGAIHSIANTLEQQGAAVDDIARSAEIASESVTSTNSFLGTVVTLVEQTNSSAKTINATSQTLSSQSKELSQAVDIFINKVEAA